MSALHVVVRPLPASTPSSTLSTANGLLDVVVEGVNITARIGAGQALALLAELGQAVAGLTAGRRDRSTLQLYADDEAWELGLEADAEDVLVTVYRCGPQPEVSVHERHVSATALHQGVLQAIEETLCSKPAAGIAASLRAARRALLHGWPPAPHGAAARTPDRVAPRAVKGLGLTACAEFRCGQRAETGAALEEARQLERADLHALLVRGPCEIAARGRVAHLGSVHPFLLAERLVALAEEVLDAWQLDRPIFRRIEVGQARLAVRRGPGEEPLTLSINSPGSAVPEPSVSFPKLDPPDFVRCVSRFASALCDTFVRHDPAQARNLRLTALAGNARMLTARLVESLCDDSVTNPEPDNYRLYIPTRARPQRQGIWEHGGKMRFIARWVAAIPNIDLRATFLCGERLIVSSARETACIHRSSGTVAWRVATMPAASVATPVGLVRIHPEGRVVLHELESGSVRFATSVTPRVGGGAAGAVVHGPGLPKLLVLTEGDRRITAVDLVSGDVRWRYTARRPAAYRVRRAGKLLLVAGGDSALVALDAGSGQVVWRRRERLPFYGTLAVSHDAAFAISATASLPGRLHYLDPWSGQLRWTAKLEERPVPGQAPLITPDVVVVPCHDRRGVGAMAYDRATGEQLWVQAPGLASPTTAWLALDDTVLANTAAGALLCLDARHGGLRYNHVFSRHVDADQPRRLEPILRNGALFVPQHQVHVVRPRDGEIIGTVPTDLIPDLLRVDERCDLYIAEESGHLAAFGVAPRLTLVS
jgi:hypothetical protein